MTRLIALSFFAVTLMAMPSHAQLWDEEQPSETVDPKNAGDTPKNGSDDEAEIEEEKPQPDPLIIKSNKVFKRVRRLDLSSAFGYNPLINSFANNALNFNFWAVFPSLNKGFLDGINDSFSWEAGIYAGWVWSGYTVIRHYFSFMPAAGGRWNFHLTPRWNIYAAARIGLLVNDFQLRGAGAIGALWKYDDDFAIRAEMDSQHLLNLGVSFPY